MKIEIRETTGSVQGIDEKDHTAAIRLVTYNRVDTYGSNWQRGVFDESLQTRHIPAVWAHEKTQIFGSIREHDIQPTHTDVSVAFADLDAVPLARTAFSLMKDGHVRDTSFGFARVDGGTLSRRTDRSFEPSLDGERERITKAELIEVSPVLKGAVPGSQVLAVRSADGDQLTLTEAEIFTAVEEGRIDVREALRVLEEREPVVVEKPPPVDPAQREVIDLSRLILERAPHTYKPTNTDGSVCSECGGQKDAKAHTTSREAALELAATPVRSDDAHALIQAADAAVDTALGMLAAETLSERAISALGLLMAADAALDRSQDLLHLADSDEDDGPVGALARAFPEAAAADPPAPVTREPDEVDAELDRMLSGQRSYGVRAPKPYGNVTYADPKNGKYPIDTAAHARAAWSYINKPENAAKYPLNGVTLSQVKDKITAACKKFGIEVSGDNSGKG